MAYALTVAEYLDEPLVTLVNGETTTVRWMLQYAICARDLANIRYDRDENRLRCTMCGESQDFVHEAERRKWLQTAREAIHDDPESPASAAYQESIRQLWSDVSHISTAFYYEPQSAQFDERPVSEVYGEPPAIPRR